MPKNTVVKKSHIHGKGLFANRSFKKGDEIIEYTGEKISQRESNKREKEYIKQGYTLLVDCNKFSIDGIKGGSDAIYANHKARGGNVELQVFDDESLWLVAIKNIKAGDELTFNYGFDPVTGEEV